MDILVQDRLVAQYATVCCAMLDGKPSLTILRMSHICCNNTATVVSNGKQPEQAKYTSRVQTLLHNGESRDTTPGTNMDA